MNKRDDKTENRKLFVAGIPWAMDSRDLGEVFSGYGEITEAKVIRDHESGKSRGFGFVTFEKEVDAIIACKEMNGAEVGERVIRVNHAEDEPVVKNHRGGSRQQPEVVNQSRTSGMRERENYGNQNRPTRRR